MHYSIPMIPTLLPLPPRHGTPGSANSRRVPNTAPTFSDLKHSPIIPQANEAVTISVRASDPDGVASATLSYRVNPAVTFIEGARWAILGSSSIKPGMVAITTAFSLIVFIAGAFFFRRVERGFADSV